MDGSATSAPRPKRDALLLALVVIPALAASAARCAVYLSWMDSPLRHAHLVRGYDMIKLLRWGVEGGGVRDLYTLAIGGLSWLGLGSTSLVSYIVGFQMLFGVFLAVLTAVLAWVMSRHIHFASCAGVLAGLYAPMIFYECFILKESLYTLCVTVAFAMAFILWSRRPSIFLAAIAGATAAPPLLIRFPGLAVAAGSLTIVLVAAWKLKETDSVSSVARRVGFSVAAWGLAFLFSAVLFSGGSQCGGTIACFNWPGYAFRAGAVPAARNLNPEVEVCDSLIDSAPRQAISMTHYFSKLGAVLWPWEIPDNLNLYFCGRFLSPLRWLLGPALLVPLGFCGLLMAFLDPSARKWVFPAMVWAGAVIAPMLIFVPLARYRVALTPLLAICAAYLLFRTWGFFRGGRVMAGIAVCVVVSAYLLAYPLSSSERGNLRHGDLALINNAGLALMDKGDPASAFNAFEAVVRIKPSELRYRLNLASSLLALGRPEEAEALLLASPHPQDSARLVKLLCALSDCEIVLGRPAKAVELLRRAAQTADADAATLESLVLPRLRNAERAAAAAP